MIIPDLDEINLKMKNDPAVKTKLKEKGEYPFLLNMSEWLAVEKSYVALGGSGHSCNKMGVTYSAFRWQADICSNLPQRYPKVAMQQQLRIHDFFSSPPHFFSTVA